MEERDPKKQIRICSNFLQQDYDVVGNSISLRSRVHKQQVRGLLAFAQTLQWPHLAEASAYAQTAYADFVRGIPINSLLYDWLYGLVLPGRWFAVTIMTALVQCSSSIRDHIGDLPSTSNYGLVLPQDPNGVSGRH